MNCDFPDSIYRAGLLRSRRPRHTFHYRQTVSDLFEVAPWLRQDPCYREVDGRYFPCSAHLLRDWHLCEGFLD